jgi:hypothetical protein
MPYAAPCAKRFGPWSPAMLSPALWLAIALVLAGCGSVKRAADDDGGADVSGDDAGDDGGDGGGDDGMDDDGGAGDARLSVTLDGSGSGVVTSTPSGIDCPGACEGTFAAGTTVVLNAAPAAGSRVAAWSAAGCGTAASCEVELAGDTEVVATFALEPNLAFVTSVAMTSDFGGIAQADAVCTDAAASAGLEGTFVAWLSTSDTSAIDRIAGASGWVRTDGADLADTPERLAAGEVFHPLRIDETGAAVPLPQFGDVWTGTGADGLATTFLCGDWMEVTASGTIGSTGQGSEGWTDALAVGCRDVTRRLYCFGIDRVAEVRPARQEGRIAFLSAGTFTPSSLAAADALCADEATAAGLDGEFVALLATQAASAISRVETDGPVWSRPDGVPLAATVADFVAGAAWETSITETAAGDYVTGLVWTGAASPSVAGSSASTCGDWASPMAGTSGTIGRASAIEVAESFASASFGCQFSAHLYCFERTGAARISRSSTSPQR